jgi:hypothetical protein
LSTSEIPVSARRAQVGDRLFVTLLTLPRGRPAELIDTVIRVAGVARMPCGCDKVFARRPRSVRGSVVEFHPAAPCSWRHAAYRTSGIDYDEARAAAADRREVS